MNIRRHSQRNLFSVCGTFLLMFTLLLTACGGTSSPQKTAKPTTSATPTTVHVPTNMYVVAQIHERSGVMQEHAYLYALRVSDGSRRWQYMTTEKGSIASVNEIDGQVYIMTLEGSSELGAAYSLVVLRVSDGSVLWHYSTALLSRPVLEKGVIYLGVREPNINGRSRILALNSTDGTPHWQYRIETTSSYNHTLIADIQRYGDSLFVTALNTGDHASDIVIYALRLGDGTLRWQKTISERTENWITFQEQGQNYALYGVYGGDTKSYTVTLLRLSDGKILWRKTISETDLRYQISDFLNENGKLYLTNGIYDPTGSVDNYSVMDVLDITDGAVLFKYKWTREQPDVNYLRVKNGIAYIASDQVSYATYTSSSNVQIDALRVSDQAKLWHYTAGVDVSDDKVLMTNDALYVTTISSEGGSDTHVQNLTALGVGDGKILWTKQWKVQGFLGIGTMQLENDVIYIGMRTLSSRMTEDIGSGAVCAYKASDGSSLWCQKTTYGVYSMTFN